MSLKTVNGEFFVLGDHAFLRRNGPHLKCAEGRYVNFSFMNYELAYTVVTSFT